MAKQETRKSETAPMQSDTKPTSLSPYDVALQKYEQAVHDHAAHKRARDDCNDAAQRAHDANEIAREELRKSEQRLEAARLELTTQIIAKNGY